MVCALCNSSTLYYDEKDKIWKCTGDPTESALEVLAKKVDISKEG
jgi:magnesium-transporting ATPase (P-type)